MLYVQYPPRRHAAPSPPNTPRRNVGVGKDRSCRRKRIKLPPSCQSVPCSLRLVVPGVPLEARILEGDVDQIENQNEEEVEEDEGDVIESDGDGDGIDNE